MKQKKNTRENNDKQKHYFVRFVFIILINLKFLNDTKHHIGGWQKWQHKCIPLLHNIPHLNITILQRSEYYYTKELHSIIILWCCSAKKKKHIKEGLCNRSQVGKIMVEMGVNIITYSVVYGVWKRFW